MPLAALFKNLWKRFIEVKDSSRQLDSIIWYGHPESTDLFLSARSWTVTPFISATISHEKKQSHLSKLRVTTCIVTFPIRGFLPYIINLGKIHVFCYYFCTLYLQTLNKTTLVFSGKAYGDLGCWTVNCRGLRSKPEQTHPSCTGGTQISFSTPVSESVPAHLHKPEGFLCPQRDAKTKASQIQ